MPRAFRDVTPRGAFRRARHGADDLARFKAVEAAEKAIVAACEKKPDTRCQFATFDGGLFFAFTEFEEVKDVRLVYAPPEDGRQLRRRDRQLDGGHEHPATSPCSAPTSTASPTRPSLLVPGVD